MIKKGSGCFGVFEKAHHFREKLGIADAAFSGIGVPPTALKFEG
jgi:hypothetical protein